MSTIRLCNAISWLDWNKY